MSRNFTAILVSSALAFAGVSTNALSAPMGNRVPRDTAQPAPGENQSPLTAGGAAGIAQAQGLVITPLVAGATVAGIFAVGVLVIGDNTDDDSGTTTTTTTTTGTN